MSTYTERHKKYEHSKRGRETKRKRMNPYMKLYRKTHPEKMKEWNKRLYTKRKEKINLLKIERGGKCEICGYNEYLGALDFHHKNNKEKSFAIGHRRGFSIDKLREEVKKCALLCANCHREVEAGITKLKDS